MKLAAAVPDAMSHGSRDAAPGQVSGDLIEDRFPAFENIPAPVHESRGLATDYVIRVATTRDDHHVADSLMRKLYRWRGYSTGVAQEHPSGITLVASEARRAVATVSVGVDSDESLACEALFPDEVARMRREGARLCEFTRLAVDRAGRSMDVLGRLFHGAYLYARCVQEGSHLLAEVNPRHVGFYVRMLGFRVAGPQRTCKRVEAPAVLISLALDHAEDQIARCGGRPGRARERRSLYPHFFAPQEEQRILARLFGTDTRGRGAGDALMAA